MYHCGKKQSDSFLCVGVSDLVRAQKPSESPKNSSFFVLSFLLSGFLFVGILHLSITSLTLTFLLSQRLYLTNLQSLEMLSVVSLTSSSSFPPVGCSSSKDPGVVGGGQRADRVQGPVSGPGLPAAGHPVARPGRPSGGFSGGAAGSGLGLPLPHRQPAERRGPGAEVHLRRLQPSG